MEVTIEHAFCTYCKEVTELYFLLINTILFSIDEKELRSNIELLWKAVPIDKYFTYGYGGTSSMSVSATTERYG